MSVPTDAEIARAQRHARFSARNKRPVASCPYNANGDGQERVLAMRWVQAYLTAAPADLAPINFDDADTAGQAT